ASTVWHPVDHQSAALGWIGRCDNLKVGNVVNPAFIGGRKVDICDDLVVVRIMWLEFTKYPARVDRIRCRWSGSRGSQNDRLEADDGCLIDDDALDGSIARRIPADRCSESDNRCKIPETPVLPWAHSSSLPLAGVTACGLPAGRHCVCTATTLAVRARISSSPVLFRY